MQITSSAVSLNVEDVTASSALLVEHFGFRVLVVVALALLVAVVLGTPGCEIGVVHELVRRLRGEADGTEALFCVVGLHQLDAWETRRPWHRGR